GYNFGGGNAQLDFRDMRFDWASAMSPACAAGAPTDVLR
ncbi:hypothetical protein K3000_27395, partial [Pseudomonas aeruginosa]|nr:hypothetical protein [Pseudomonas aeruginosa]